MSKYARKCSRLDGVLCAAAEGANVAAAVRVGRSADGLYLAQRSTAGPDHVLVTLTDACRTFEQAETLACAALLSVRGGEDASRALRAGTGGGSLWRVDTTPGGVRVASVTDGSVRAHTAVLDASMETSFIGGLTGAEARRKIAAVDPHPDDLDRAVLDRYG